MSEKARRYLIALAVLAITAVAAWFRLFGIGWGLPNSLHLLTYHPDEVFQVAAMWKLNPYELQFDPGFYSYPTFYMMIGSVALRIAESLGVMRGDNLASSFLIARLITAAMGIATVPLIYAIAARFFGRPAGLVGALIAAIVPLSVIHSHFATVDAPAAFWVAVALYGVSVVASGRRLSASILTGIAVGLAFGTKYTAGMVALPLIAAHLLRDDENRWFKRIFQRDLWLSMLAVVIGFVVSSPGVLVAPGRYIGGFLFEMRHAASGHGMLFVGRGPGWFDFLTQALGYGLGVFLLAMTLCAAAYALVKRTRADWILLAFVIPYFAMISLSEVRFSRYALLLIPPIAALVGRMIVAIYDLLAKEATATIKLSWLAISLFVVIYTGIYAIAVDRLFTPPDVRDEAAIWLDKRAPAGTTIGFATVPWFYSPPLAPEMIGAVGKMNRYILMENSKFRLIANPEKDWDTELLTDLKPEYVVVTDFEYEDYLRLHIPETVAFFKTLNAEYAQEKVFEKPFEAFGIRFGTADRLPHDSKYMAPKVCVYRRK